MAAVAVGGRVEVTQIGDVTVNERTDLVYVEDGESAALLEKKTTVAEVPQGDGTTAVVAGVEYRVRAAEQPHEQELSELRANLHYEINFNIRTHLLIYNDHRLPS